MSGQERDTPRPSPCIRPLESQEPGVSGVPSRGRAHGGHAHGGHAHGGHAHGGHAHGHRGSHGFLAHDAPPGASVSTGRRNRNRLAFMLGLTLLYMCAEAIGGTLSGSLALLADAAHMLSDAGALALSLFALWLTLRSGSPRMTFGLSRTEILAAMVNGAMLVVLACFLVLEAIERLKSPQPVQAGMMMAIATGGLVINLIGLRLLHEGREHNLNIRAAWLHLLADALGSVGALLAGAFILWRSWYWIDPLVSLFIAALVVYSAWGLLKEAVGILMEGAPPRLDVEEVRLAIVQVAGVTEVHDLHIWTISSGRDALSGHIIMDPGGSSEQLLTELHRMLEVRFSVFHITLQIEPPGFEEHRCRQ